jgi:hypothetical protein
VTHVIDAQAMMSSRDCPEPGCIHEAESGRTHCRFHRELGEPFEPPKRVIEDRPAVPDPPALPSPTVHGSPIDGTANGGATRTPRPRRIPRTRDEIIEALQAHARENGGLPPTANEWVLMAADRPNREDVKREFGSWADGVEAAGFPRPRRGVPARLLAEKDSSSERAGNPEPEEGPRSPTPDAGGLDDELPAMGARTQAAPAVGTGEPEQLPAPDPDERSAGVRDIDVNAVRQAVLDAVKRLFELLDTYEQLAPTPSEGEPS